VFLSISTLNFSPSHFSSSLASPPSSSPTPRGLRRGFGEAVLPGGGDGGRATLGFRLPGQGGVGTRMAMTVAEGRRGEKKAATNAHGRVSPKLRGGGGALTRPYHATAALLEEEEDGEKNRVFHIRARHRQTLLLLTACSRLLRSCGYCMRCLG
jgi:hypothetical protein